MQNFCVYYEPATLYPWSVLLLPDNVEGVEDDIYTTLHKAKQLADMKADKEKKQNQDVQ